MSYINLTSRSDLLNETSTDSTNNTPTKERVLYDTDEQLAIALYPVIFFLSVGGNILVLLTLLREKRMRTITNMFLLNLALSDMLLSVLCMPFTLVATIVLRNFIFGEAMCILIRYFQAVSVGVSCYTLVVISIERYYAICQPLKSRKWQTKSHARKMIIGVWITALVIMSPIAAFQRIIPLKSGGFACREIWPIIMLVYDVDKVYSILLAFILLFVPLVTMSVFYGLMGKTLWIPSKKNQDSGNSIGHESQARSLSRCPSAEAFSRNLRMTATLLNSSHHHRDVNNRKRVIRMLAVIVLQYFICHTPSYVLSTWQYIDHLSARNHFSPTAKSLIFLLAYTSSFIHPITYCFMNQNFRRGFMVTFRCIKQQNRASSTAMNSEV